MSRLLSNGCSFLTPRNKDGVKTFTTEIIAEQYNLQLYNLAMGGRGNSRISFTTKAWIEQNGHSDIFVIIGWSSSYRNDYVTNDGWKKGRIPGFDLTWRTWKTLDHINFLRKNPGWDIENNAITNFIDHVFDMQNYFHLKKIPYVMYNSLPNDIQSSFQETKAIKKAIDLKRFFRPNTSHLQFITERKLIVSPKDPHPSTEGHLQWANQLRNYIDANNLRTIT